jgi:hypothetical protein
LEAEVEAAQLLDLGSDWRLDEDALPLEIVDDAQPLLD